MTPLDIYDDMPRPMRRYLQYNGWHFNKTAYEFAVSLMKKKTKDSTTKVEPMKKEDIDKMLQNYGVDVENKGNYDYCYVAMMCKAVFFGSSIEDEQHLALFVKDTCDDVDAPEGTTMRKWFATMTAGGISVDWESFVE